MPPVIDMHCDTLMHVFLTKGKDADVFDCPDLSVDVRRLFHARAMAQFFSIFVPPAEVYKESNHEVISDEEYIAGCTSVFNNTIQRYPDWIRQAKSADEIEANFKAGFPSAVLTMEDGVAVQKDMANLDRFYEAGVRALSLTWNFKNCFGSPNSKDETVMNTGLTDFGKEAVKHMQDIGMLVDVSHLSDGGFRDVVKLAKVPFVATHSDSRAVVNHPRNMTDDMIRALAKAGGVMGINFSPMFLNGTPGNRRSEISRMVEMAVHEKEIGGIEVVAMGTDFDGIGGELEVKSPDDMHLLCDALAEAGFSVSDIDAVMYGNALRVFHEAMH